MTEIESAAAKAARKAGLPYQPISDTIDGDTVDQIGYVMPSFVDTLMRAQRDRVEGKRRG